MSVQYQRSGIVFYCNQTGEILSILRDDLGITSKMATRTSLFDIVDRDSREKTQQFLETVIETDSAFGWEVNILCDSQLMGLSLYGGVTDKGIIVCGVQSRAGIGKLFDEMMIIQNEQLNSLRIAIKQERLEAERHSQREREMLEEFSRLNNELVNTQRDLSRRNSELGIANTRLESLATTDGLTGLKNHRAFQEALECEWTRAHRYGTSLSVLMVDVDHFKQFNDKFGHPAGDLALKQVAGILTRECRVDSFVARYGGEEFIVIMPNCTADEAAVVAKRVRHGVETSCWKLRPITVSIGMATAQACMPNRAALVAQADAALYRAKSNGRNQVCRASDLNKAVFAS